MDREEIEKLIEETARKEHARRGGMSIESVRSILNVLFLVCAAVGLVLYFALPDRHLVGICVIGGGMFLKIIEFFLRFLF